jgi:hypothetical protein
MKTFTGTFASFAIITALATPALAQDPQPAQPQTQTQEAQPAPRQPVPLDDQKPKTDMSSDAAAAEESSITGELVKVDTDAMELVIKSADDTQHTFRYADSTKVVGAEGQVSGLATKAGQLVTVHFTQGAGDSRIATKVSFDKKQ